MIQVIYDEKEDEIIPVITCDVCNNRIEDVLNAVAVNQNVFDMGETPTKILHAHKGRCHDSAEAKIGKYAGWEELSAHLYYLCKNLGLTSQWFEARDRPQEKNDR